MESKSKMWINTVKIEFAFKWLWKCVEDCSVFPVPGYSTDVQWRNVFEIGKDVTLFSIATRKLKKSYQLHGYLFSSKCYPTFCS